MLLYYVMRQYPNRGDYDINANVASIVVIQTHDPLKANFIALSKGIYFDGIEKGIDCSCCDDRWKPFHTNSKGHNMPMVEHTHLLTYLEEWVQGNDNLRNHPSRTLAYIYFSDGEKEAITVGNVCNSHHLYKYIRR